MATIIGGMPFISFWSPVDWAVAEDDHFSYQVPGAGGVFNTGSVKGSSFEYEVETLGDDESSYQAYDLISGTATEFSFTSSSGGLITSVNRIEGAWDIETLRGFKTTEELNDFLLQDEDAATIAHLFDGRGGDDLIEAHQGSAADLINNATHAFPGATLFGGVGDDVVRGAVYDETISGDAGADLLSGGAGGDIIVGGAGDDVLWGDWEISGSPLATDGEKLQKPARAGNSSISAALDLTGYFSLDENSDIYAATILPHATVNAVGGGSFDYYNLSISRSGIHARIDIDHAGGEGPTPLFNSVVRILDSGGKLLNEVDNGDLLAVGDPDVEGGGSQGDSGQFDTLFDFEFTAAGNYFIEVGNAVDAAVTSGLEYDLHVSLLGEVAAYDDRLEGGAGADELHGGAGADSAYYGNSGASVQVDLSTGNASGGEAAGDRFFDIENIHGSVFGDQLFGDGSANLIVAEAGDDFVLGRDGIDSIVGGDGNDTLNGGADGDYMYGGDGDDIYHVDTGYDLVDEGAFFPEFGTGGTDTIVSASDFYWDIASVGENLIVLEDVVDAGGDGVTAVGGIFDNTITGHSGIDIMFGRGGSDTYRGGDGVNWYSLSLLGLTEENAYVGVDGPNTVIMDQRESGPFSYHIVFEFETGKDKVNVSDYAAVNRLASGADVIARAVDDGAGNSYIALGDGLDYLYMVGLEKADLVAGDFLV